MIDENDLKEIPYGVADYYAIRKHNLYYVDKTKYIRNIEKKGRYLFFIRPRRFGKSLFLATLEAYYDILYKDQFDFLFQGTYIHENPTDERNSYLILYLNFSCVECNPSGVNASFLHHLKQAVLVFIRKYEKLLHIDIKREIEEFDSKESVFDVMLAFLSHYGRSEYKVYVIIDEYDSFANMIIKGDEGQSYPEITHVGGFFHSFFNMLKAGTSEFGAPISRLFMTGVTPITMDDVRSGFNIGTDISLAPDLN